MLLIAAYVIGAVALSCLVGLCVGLAWPRTELPSSRVLKMPKRLLADEKRQFWR